MRRDSLATCYECGGTVTEPHFGNAAICADCLRKPVPTGVCAWCRRAPISADAQLAGRLICAPCAAEYRIAR